MDLFTLVGTITINAQDAMENINSLMTKVGELDAQLNGTALQTETTSKEVENTVTQSTERTTTKTGEVLRSWNVFLGNMATQAVNKGYDFFKGFTQGGFSLLQNMEKWEASFKTHLGGSEEAASAFMKKLQQFAIDTPLSMEEVVQQATNLFGAGFDADAIIPAMSMLGDLTKGDSTIFSRVARAYWQAMGKPHLVAQDANQMIEAGVPIWQIIADYFNATERDGKTDWTKDFVSNLGTWNNENPDFEHEMVTAEEVHNAIVMATSEGGDYYNAMNNLMDTEYGQAQKMLDAYQIMSANVMRGIFEVFKGDTIPALNEIIQKLDEWANKNPDTLKNLGQAFSDFATNGLDKLSSGLTTLVSTWDKHQDAIKMMSAILGGLLMVTGHPAAGVSLLMLSELSGTKGLEKLYMNEDGSYRTNILFPGLSEQMNDSLPGEDKEAGRYHYFTDKAREIAESLWDMERMGLTGADVSGFQTLMSQAYTEFGKIADTLGVTDTEAGVSALLVDLVNQMMTLDKTKENLPDDWFYDPDKAEPETDWMLHYNIDPSALIGSSGANSIPALIAAVQALTGEIPDAIASGIGNITVTGYVTTGDVRLNEGTIVGALTPMFDLKLGQIESQANWG